MNFMNIPAIKNQQQTLIKRNFDKIYAHEAAHKRAGGALAGAIVIEKTHREFLWADMFQSKCRF